MKVRVAEIEIDDRLNLICGVCRNMMFQNRNGLFRLSVSDQALAQSLLETGVQPG